MTEQRPSTIRALIVDDEQLARRGLRLRLEQVPDIEICGEARHGREALRMILADRPDLVFLDIQMPGLSGFDVVRALQGHRLPIIVFVTAFDQFAIKAFEAHALDYLLKPIDDSRLHQALYRVRAQLDQRQAVEHRSRLLELVDELTGGAEIDLEALLAGDTGAALGTSYLDRLPIREGRDTECVPVAAIESIEAAGDYMCVHANNRTYVLRGTMKQLESRLDPRLFQRVHRSTIVNVRRVRRLRPHMNGEYFLSLESGSEAKLSRNYRDKLKFFVPELKSS